MAHNAARLHPSYLVGSSVRLLQFAHVPPDRQGDVDVVNVLCMVKKKALAVLDIDGRTALHLAALLGRTGAVVALLAADASLGAALVAQDKLGMAPLHYAAEQVRQRLWAGLVGVTQSVYVHSTCARALQQMHVD